MLFLELNTGLREILLQWGKYQILLLARYGKQIYMKYFVDEHVVFHDVYSRRVLSLQSSYNGNRI
jgi:hypothetical protein